MQRSGIWVPKGAHRRIRTKFSIIKPPHRATITVNGNWRVIFRFFGEDAELVDYLDYH